MLLQVDMELIEAYGISRAPAVVIVQPDGTRDGDPADGDVQIRVLFAHVLDVPGNRPEPSSQVGDAWTGPVLRIGDPVPAIQLPAIDGEIADLADAHGAETIPLFWSPTCGYCLRMLSDLLTWEANRTEGSHRLVIVSTGSADMTRAHRFRSLVVLAHGQVIGRRFGTQGTPAAIRISAHGQVAAPVASGMTAVLTMVRADPLTRAVTIIAANGHGGLPGSVRT